MIPMVKGIADLGFSGFYRVHIGVVIHETGLIYHAGFSGIFQVSSCMKIICTVFDQTTRISDLRFRREPWARLMVVATSIPSLTE